jgi:hypothetical protein
MFYTLYEMSVWNGLWGIKIRTSNKILDQYITQDMQTETLQEKLVVVMLLSFRRVLHMNGNRISLTALSEDNE